MPAASSTANGAAIIKAESPEPAHDTVLKIAYTATGNGSDNDLVQVIQPLLGELPRDEPVLPNFTALENDVRSMPPMTVRFTSKADADPESIPLYHQPEAVRLAVWRKMEQLMPGLTLSERRPTVMLDYRRIGQRTFRGTIDLTFTSWEAVSLTTEKLAEIELEGENGKSCRYIYYGVTNSLPGSVFVLECLRLPVNSANAHDVYEAFASLTSAIGKVLGLGKVVTTSKKWGVDSSDNGLLKIYVELARNSMLLTPWQSLALQLPTHFRWHGIAYILRYRGDHFHEKAVVSPCFPLVAGYADASGEDVEVEEAAPTASKHARSATSEPGADSTAAKKARPSEE